MSKRCPKRAAKTTDAAARLPKVLAKRTKRELIAALVEFAADDRRILRRLDSRSELEAPPKELVATVRQAIADGASRLIA